MKKVLIIFSMFLIFCAYLVVAQDATVSEKGYDCLETEVAGKCSTLSSEEQIFSLLAIDRCKTEVMENSDNKECWPDAACRIETTAQAILALNSVGTSTADAENWLLSQEISPPNVDWLLQIESEPTTCSISYKTESPLITIDEDRRLSGNLGSCLSIYDDYWIEIAPQCYNEEFKISCNKLFFTNLLYKKQGSEIIYVPKGTNSASAGGKTTEKINSFCFRGGTSSCDYEGTLWAALVLNLRGHDTSAYLPYLITMADENSRFIPESFLYSLTGSFKEELLLNQKESQFWEESGDMFYDTAVALHSLQQEEPQEKTNAKEWLEEVQRDDGCWQGGITNTAFILFSAWPKKIISTGETKPDCEDAEYNCMTSTACQASGGNVLVDYGGCVGTNICCSVESLLENCLAQGGEICSSGELCSGETVAAADTERCCVSGTCVEIEDEEDEERSECERHGGECKSFCSDDEETSAYDCPSFDTCCLSKSERGYTGLIILGILISLTVLGIIFRKKLRKFLLKIKSKFKGKSAPSAPISPRGFPPGPSASIARRTTPRRVLPPGQRRPVRRPATQKPKGDLDNVLKKLKEMGK